MDPSTEIKWPWFQRHFSFDFPPEKLPDIVERLRGISLRLAPLREMDVLMRTAQIDETWSIQENVGHLLTLEPLWLGRVNDVLDGCERLRDADLENRATGDAKFNDVEMESLIDQFNSNRNLLIGKLESTPITLLETISIHPRLEVPMRIVDVAYFVAEHDDYHLARIAQIHRQLAP